MIERRQKLAWIVLLAGFFTCLASIVAVPFLVSWVVQEARRSLDVSVQANQGTVGILVGDNETVALFAGDPAHEMDPGGAILTNATDQALMIMNSPAEQIQAMRVQVYGNTHLTVESATTPRFKPSSANYEIELNLSSGRILFEVPDSVGRDVDIGLVTPQGEINVHSAGQYSISSSNTETQLAVFQGEASAQTQNGTIELVAQERASLAADGSISGPLGNERNLIVNGSFDQELSEWVKLSANVEIVDQPAVDINIQTLGNEPALVLTRVGLGHADAGLRQIISADVADYSSLRLVVSMEIAEQSLGVCGEQGSECPLILRIDYVDINGVDQTWQQGFYAVGNIGTTTPDVCVACPPPLNEHQQVPYKQLAFFETDNLMEDLERLNIQPQQIKSVTIIASGHTFDTRIVDLALLARE